MENAVAVLIGQYVPIQYAAVVASVITAASAIATQLPAPTARTGVYPFVYGLLNVVALNVGKARNAGGGDVNVLAAATEAMLAATMHTAPVTKAVPLAPVPLPQVAAPSAPAP